MRLGKVEFSIGYIVDLDNERMVDQAYQWIEEDMSNIHDHEDLFSYISEYEDKTETLTERDIHSSMLDEDDEND